MERPRKLKGLSCLRVLERKAQLVMQGAPWEDMQRAGPTRQVSAGGERGGPYGMCLLGGQGKCASESTGRFHPCA